MSTIDQIPAVPLQELHERLGFSVPINKAQCSLSKPLSDWNMQQDDAPILRYLYQQFQPRRHLEFGTWMGAGTVDVLESCNADVWTLNLPAGEIRADGHWAYAQPFASEADLPVEAMRYHTDKGTLLAQTDGPGFVGKAYRDRGLAHRVHQIFCDSRAWDTADFPDGFFDTALIDGGHHEPTVTNDTRIALRLVRPGGLILWHDFCPDADVRARCPCVQGVTASIAACLDHLRAHCNDLFWIEPSWLLAAIR